MPWAFLLPFRAWRRLRLGVTVIVSVAPSRKRRQGAKDASMRSVIVGSGGQLGMEFCARLPDAVACPRHMLDLAEAGSVRQKLIALAPELVLNCAAYNAVDDAERDFAGAFAVNAFGVAGLARACHELGATLVHFSTNYVFGRDEARRQPYREADAPGPQGVYAVSKLAGEELVRAYCPAHFIIRVCGLFGTRTRGGQPANFIQRMAARARRGEPVRVVNDQVCTPTPVWDVAAATLRLLETQAYGLYHFTSAGECTWHEFAQAALRQQGLDVAVEPVSTRQLAAPASRPAYSVLDCTAYDRFGFGPRATWQESLRACGQSA
jgi:dTDP-4-dehydrorhamnose reductase